MKQLLDRMINSTSIVRDLREQVSRQGAYAAGHYHSPIPSQDDVQMELQRQQKRIEEGVPGVELNDGMQRELLEQFATYYAELPFPESPAPGHRYYYRNDWFGYSDAIFLNGFLRKFQPPRIIEVGSGYSSAVMLDTAQAFMERKPEFTFIEPNPSRLLGLLTEDDKKRVTLHDRKVQEVPLSAFDILQAGDLLFIDSSHVVKSGSDLLHLMFEVIPRLKRGVIVHFHDVHYPFGYAPEWLTEGRYWNENYFLRAFLSYNTEWRILFFNHYANMRFAEFIGQKMPLCALDHGGSLYIQRD